VLKIFVDEMALWMAEMGGFLEPTTPAAVPIQNAFQSPVLDNGAGRSHSGSRMSSMGPNGQPPPGDDGSQSMFMQNGGQQGGQGYSGQQQQQSQQRHQMQHQQQQQAQINGLPFLSQHQAQQMGHSLSQQGHKLQQQQHQQQQQHDADIDDSGIGMSLMDDDMNSLGKYTGVNGGMEGMVGQEMRVEGL
jgi:regulatory factor X